MFKTSPERRAIVRRSREKAKARGKSPEEKERERAYYRHRARRLRHRINELRRARRDRHSFHQRPTASEQRERWHGLGFVTQGWLAKDDTRFVGPGSHSPRRRALEEEADRILRAAAARTPHQEMTKFGPEAPPDHRNDAPEGLDWTRQQFSAADLQLLAAIHVAAIHEDTNP